MCAYVQGSSGGKSGAKSRSTSKGPQERRHQEMSQGIEPYVDTMLEERFGGKPQLAGSHDKTMHKVS